MQRVAIANFVYSFRPLAIDDPVVKTREYVTLLVDSPLNIRISV